MTTPEMRTVVSMRLQNMANYFLMSLAIADLLVSVTVMPLAMTVLIYGAYIHGGPKKKRGHRWVVLLMQPFKI